MLVGGRIVIAALTADIRIYVEVIADGGNLNIDVMHLRCYSTEAAEP